MPARSTDLVSDAAASGTTVYRLSLPGLPADLPGPRRGGMASAETSIGPAADEDVNLRIELSAAGLDLDWARLRALQSSRTAPSISLLMATVPGPTMSRPDIARLRQLAHVAQRRLVAEPGAGAIQTVERRLASAVAAVEGNATDRGVAILVSAHQAATFLLPFAPRDRVVVDPRFAIRDLEFALQYYPRFRVVVLGIAPRVLEGPAIIWSKPSGSHRVEGPALFGSSAARPGRRSVRPEHWLVRRARLAAGCAEADRLLEQRIQVHRDHAAHRCRRQSLAIRVPPTVPARREASSPRYGAPGPAPRPPLGRAGPARPGGLAGEPSRPGGSPSSSRPTPTGMWLGSGQRLAGGA